jgi:hypothetical protein
VRGRGAGVADGGERPRAARLRRHDLREAAAAGGLMRTNIPAFRLPAERARRGDRLHRRHGRRPALRHAGPSMEWLLRRATTPSSSAAARRGARTSTSPAGTTATASSSASTSSSRSTSGTSRSRAARADHRRRQHGDGLLPHRQAARRHGREGHGARGRSTSRRRRGSWRTPRRSWSRSSRTTRRSASSSRTAA